MSDNSEKRATWRDLFRRLPGIGPSRRAAAAGEPESAQDVDALWPAMAAGRPTQGGDGWGKSGGAAFSFFEKGKRPTGDHLARTIQNIRDYNPDASLAIWNFLRICLSGLTVDVVDRITNLPDEDGLRFIREFTDSDSVSAVAQEYGGGVDPLAAITLLALLTKGAAGGELELSDTLEVVDWHPVDPASITFLNFDQPDGTTKLMPTVDEEIALPPAQFRYLPLDPEVGSPYGRNPLLAMIEAIFFQMEVLRELKDVVHFAAWPRIDVTVVDDMVHNNAPEHLKEPGQEQNLWNWKKGFMDQVLEIYEDLKPDDAFVHWDTVDVEIKPGGAPGVDVSTLVKVLDTQITSGLKQLPILLGRQAGSTTTHASVQWQIFASAVSALRAPVVTLLGWMGTMTLRLSGSPSRMVIRMNPVRTQDRLRDAQASAIEFDTAIRRFFAGFITHDDAAQEIEGHPAQGDMLIEYLLKLPAARVNGDDAQREKDKKEGEPSKDEDEGILNISMLQEALGIDVEEAGLAWAL